MQKLPTLLVYSIMTLELCCAAQALTLRSGSGASGRGRWTRLVGDCIRWCTGQGILGEVRDKTWVASHMSMLCSKAMEIYKQFKGWAM
jgi:hypothetical protein